MQSTVAATGYTESSAVIAGKEKKKQHTNKMHERVIEVSWRECLCFLNHLLAGFSDTG